MGRRAGDILMPYRSIPETPLKRRDDSLNHRRSAFPIRRFASAVALASAVWSAGCETGSRESAGPAAARLPALDALAPVAPHGAVVAQGQLQPDGGVVSLIGPTGDRLLRWDVAEGDRVKAGQSLGELESLAARSQELRVAQTQLREARARAEAEKRVAEARLEVARIGLAKAELQRSQAEQRLARAEAEGGQLDLLRQTVTLAENKLDQLRQAARDESAGRLVSPAALDQQELEVRQARSEWESARQQAREGLEMGALAVQAARGEVVAAEAAAESVAATVPLESLEQQVELMSLQVAAVRLHSPIDGKVLSLDVSPGDSLATRPLARVADTSRMVCRAEVNVAEMRRVVVGAETRLSSPALSRPLAGTVRSVSRLVGSPQLPSPSPLARVDWRSAEVMIEIAPGDVERAAPWIHLQVDVAIAAAPESAPDDAPGDAGG